MATWHVRTTSFGGAWFKTGGHVYADLEPDDWGGRRVEVTGELDENWARALTTADQDDGTDYVYRTGETSGRFLNKEHALRHAVLRFQEVAQPGDVLFSAMEGAPSRRQLAVATREGRS